MSASRRRALLVGAAVTAAIAVAVIVARRAQASSLSAQDMAGGFPSGNTSKAQRPSGGAANTPGNLPDSLVTQSDSLQQQVQATDGASAESPQSYYAPYGPGQQLSPGAYVTPGYGVPGGYATTNPEYNSYISGGTENMWNVGAVGSFPAQPSLSAVAAGSGSFNPMSDPNYAAAVAANNQIPGSALV